MLEELMCHINVTVSRGHAVRQSAKKPEKKLQNIVSNLFPGSLSSPFSGSRGLSEARVRLG